MEKTSSPAIALFDIDGTLLDSAALWASVPEEYLHRKGIVPTECMSDKFYELGYSNTARYLARNYLPEEDPQSIMSAFCEIAAVKYREGVSEKPFASRYLAELRSRNIRCVAVTSNMREIVTPALDQWNMTDSFEDVISIYEVGLDKRTPHFYHHIAQRLQVPEEQCVVFEDALFAAKSAKKANMYVVGVYDTGSHPDWESMRCTADRTIMGFDELLGNDVF